jgi:hypothetical protein
VSGASATDGGEALAIGIDGKGVPIRGDRHCTLTYMEIGPERSVFLAPIEPI